MTLSQPIWLLLLLPAAMALWHWPMPGRLLGTIRVAAMGLTILALAGVAVRLPSRLGLVVVVADRSRSMPASAEAHQKEIIALLEQSMNGEDQLGVVGFGSQSVIEQPPQAGRFASFTHRVDPDASHLADALEDALALIPSDRPGRILVLSDGRWTGTDPMSQAGRAAARGVAIDFRVLQRPTAGDLAIDSLEVPAQVSPGESYMMTAWIRSPESVKLRYELRRGATTIATGEKLLSAGLSPLLFRDMAVVGGAQQYELRVEAQTPDPILENNRARWLVGVEGAKPLLLVSTKSDSGLARLLRSSGVAVVAAQPQQAGWGLEDLSAYSAVLLEEVPAGRIGDAGMRNLAEWVQHAGTGLMMTGGPASFGPGGYFRSPLDPILPVSMELRQEHRKHSVAIVVALDRSGSMAVPVGGGRRKMDLANLAAAQVVEMLSAMDEVGILAVDSAAHVVAPLAPLSDKEGLKSRILRIDSMGGGIFVYEALAHAAKMLMSSSAGARHIILFADAADSEEPGRYKELLEQCRQAGITCSIIGLGTEFDVDAHLLKDIADRGGGRALFTDQPEELPRLFAQDTFVVARSSFIDEPSAIQATGVLAAITGRNFPPPPAVGGYNLTYPREDALLSIHSRDSYSAPIVATRQAGVGRVLAYTPQADGKFTGPIGQWTDVGRLMGSLARWTIGQDSRLPPNVLITQRVEEGVQRIRIHLDPAEPLALPSMPSVDVLRTQSDAPPRATHHVMSWRTADSLGIDLPMEGGAVAIATVRVPGLPGVHVLPPVTLAYSPEFRPSSDDRGESSLIELARLTGGRSRLDVAGIWSDLPRQPRLIDLAPWLLVLAVGAFLMEILERRTGWIGRLHGRPDRLFRRLRRTVTTTQPTSGVELQPAPAPLDDSPPPQTATSSPPREKPRDRADLMQALAEARRRAQQRTDRQD
jgi:Mg-chelatase subunit ChlD